MINMKPKLYCPDCDGEHEPSGAWRDCLNYWKQKNDFRLRECSGTCVCHHLYDWLIAGKYRTLMHRHTDHFAAVDESSGQRWDADTLPLLHDILSGPPTATFNPEYNAKNFQ